MNLKVAAFQTDLIWENPQENLRNFDALFAQAAPADLYVLPEMFTTGFTMNSFAFAENPQNSPTLSWMKAKAIEKKAAITGSLIIKENGSFYNRMVVVTPEGVVAEYDKRHLFRMGKENENYTQGNKRTVVKWKGFSILLQVCYDLRFPVWSRNAVDEKGNFLYDAILYVANWPNARAYAWDTLLQARAIENHAYTVGVNRVGQDENQLVYLGGTACFDFSGKQISKANDGETQIIYADWCKEKLTEFRKKFPVWMDADRFTLSND
jgi:omega-amidase